MQERGSLNTGRRIEAAAALITFMINRTAGGKADIKDFMPHEKAKPKDAPSFDDIVNFLGGINE